MYMFKSRTRFFIVIMVLKILGVKSMNYNHSHENYGSLLNSLINVNEERMKTINRMIRLNDHNFNGLLRTLLRAHPIDDIAIVVVKDINKNDPLKDETKDMYREKAFLRAPRKPYESSISSEYEPFFPEPIKYGPNDSIPVVRARSRCVFACKNAYRRVCRQFKYACSSSMRRQFKSECKDSCNRRF